MAPQYTVIFNSYLPLHKLLTAKPLFDYTPTPAYNESSLITPFRGYTSSLFLLLFFMNRNGGAYGRQPYT
jgi:hypothetical protein